MACLYHSPGDSEEEVEWEQWQGLVERGDQKTLVLTRTNPKRTGQRAPGPGPIKKADWLPIAKRYIQEDPIVSNILFRNQEGGGEIVKGTQREVITRKEYS